MFYRILSTSLLLFALAVFNGVLGSGTTHAATLSHPISHTQAVKIHQAKLTPGCSATVYFSPSDQSVRLGSYAFVTASVSCPDWIWGTDVAFNWGDGTGCVVQNTTDTTIFTHVYKHVGSYTAYGYVNGTPGNSVHIEVQY